MVWPVSTARSIFSRLAAVAETGILSIRPDADVTAVSRAVRSARGVFAQLWSAVAPEVRSIHDHVAWWGRQYMPDSADDEAMILRHAAIWGIEQRPAAKARGAVSFEGAAGEVLPAGLALAAGSVTYVTTEGGVIGPGGAVVLAAEAVEAGADGNLETGVQLATVEAWPQVARVTVAAAFSGGADAETPQEMQVRYLQRIREPAMGGAAGDYGKWVAEVARVYAISIAEGWIGGGSVGVIVALREDDGSPRPPGAQELAAIGAHLGLQGSQTGVRPVTARVVPVAAELEPVAVTVRLRPDTAMTRAAVQAAYERFVRTIGDEDDETNASAIGAVIEPSRISEAISAADGEYSHDLIVPAARYTLAVKRCPVAAAVIFED